MFVTKSVLESNVIVAGNPAKVVSYWDKYEKRTKDKYLCTKGLNYLEKRNTLKVVFLCEDNFEDIAINIREAFYKHKENKK